MFKERATEESVTTQAVSSIVTDAITTLITARSSAADLLDKVRGSVPEDGQQQDADANHTLLSHARHVRDLAEDVNNYLARLHDLLGYGPAKSALTGGHGGATQLR